MKECQKEITKDEWHLIILALQYHREHEDKDAEPLMVEKKAIYQFSNYESIHSPITYEAR